MMLSVYYRFDNEHYLEIALKHLIDHYWIYIACNEVCFFFAK